MVPFFLCLAFISIIAGFAINFTRHIKPFALVGSALLLVGSLLLREMLDENTPMPKTLGLSVVSALGAGIAQLLSITFAQTGLTEDSEYIGLTLVLMVQLLGGLV